MPGQPIDEKVRKMIYTMIDAGASTKAIVECTGASKTTVNRMRSNRPKKRPTTDDPSTHPRTHAHDGSPTHVTQVDPPTHPIEPEELSSNRAYKGMVDLIDPLRNQFKAAENITDESKRAYVMTMYADKLIKVYTKIGSWSGLDDPAPMVIAESPIDSFLQEGFDIIKAKEVTDAGSR